ncbi:MAG: glycosyltransferase family 39 protein [Candidatus Bathyarchaeota archaeon]|nr:MAG: glycosyltransferase family 39 protein [Candidatus Bathyarchaeota archaeon]
MAIIDPLNQTADQRRRLHIDGSDIAVTMFLGLLLGFKLMRIDQILFPIWDGAVSLINARNLLAGVPLYEWFRPLVLSVITAGIWLFTGENFVIIKYVHIIFTLLTGVVFYILLKKDMGGSYALAGTILLMTSTQILLWSDHMIVHGISVFFATLTVWLWRKNTAKRWILGGLSGSLALLSRYPTGFIIVVVLIAYTITHKKLFLFYSALVGLLLPLVPLYFYSPPLLVEVLFALVGHYSGLSDVPGTVGADVGTPLFYISNAWNVFKVCSILAVLALVFKSTYTKVKNRVWLFWLGSSFIIYTVIPNQNVRFTFEWTPAVVYLAMLTIFKATSAFQSLKLSSIDRSIWGIAVVTLLGVSTVYSVNDYLITFETIGGDTDPTILDIAAYIKARTSPEEVIVSDAYAPLLTLYSERIVYENKAATLSELKPFLEQGYGGNWNTTLFIIFPKIGEKGTFTVDDLNNQPYLTLEKIIPLSEIVDNAHIYDVTL